MKTRTVFVYAVTMLSLAACGDTSRQAELTNLVREPAHYHGDVITTEGVVRMHPEPLHYWVEDSALNRVRLEPGEAVAEFIDQRIEVRGRFTYTSEQGRIIQVNEVNRL